VTPPLSIVAAIAENGIIGDGGGLPWRLSSDLRRFRALTMGKPLIMGRKTFESIGRPLPGRETIIVTRNKDFSPGHNAGHGQNLFVAHDLDAALELATQRAGTLCADEIILAGGGDLYAALMDRVERMYLTLVDASPKGGVRFPVIDWSLWEERKRVRPNRDAKDETTVAFVDFRRR
jgi:dihydrofolate reductase